MAGGRVVEDRPDGPDGPYPTKKESGPTDRGPHVPSYERRVQVGHDLVNQSLPAPDSTGLRNGGRPQAL